MAVRSNILFLMLAARVFPSPLVLSGIASNSFSSSAILASFGLAVTSLSVKGAVAVFDTSDRDSLSPSVPALFVF